MQCTVIVVIKYVGELKSELLVEKKMMMENAGLRVDALVTCEANVSRLTHRLLLHTHADADPARLFVCHMNKHVCEMHTFLNPK